MNSVASRARELHAVSVRERISACALELFDDHGYDGVSVEEIAGRAGVSQRTVFRYFASKDEIVLQYERSLLDRLRDALERRPSDEGPVTALTRAYIETSSTPSDMRGWVRQRGKLLASSSYLKSRTNGEIVNSVADLSEILARRRDSDGGRAIELRVIASAVSAVAYDVWQSWVEGETGTNPADALADAFAILTASWEGIDNG
ncbi:TetR family transcriptional regulator [Gordonia sp. HNM0687]|uniref:TetR family transcriptional regulator n=1 Tax=Gordonia mangrovi TaxID=2665643 RepID=A0A6L7GU35_9ACTN|nr:TetR/AcrR family transcriptional regulator [Gordonia mangrovi]MXP23519.1 TetR family transcriptional regulator [Gordonia mangrovi]